MITLLQEHTTLAWTILASIGLALIAAIAAAIVIVRLPTDYFAKPHTPRGRVRLLSNIGGWLLVIAGIAMLPLPGPGTVIVLLGVMLADFPGKTKVQRWLLSRGPILKPANWLRARFHKPPLKAPTRSAGSHRKAIPAHS